MLPFPVDFRDAFLQRHVDQNLSSRDLRALAVKEFGSEPYKNKRVKKCSVSIRAELYARVRSHSHSGNKKICVMIEGILESWLHTQPDAPAPPVGAGPTVVPAPAASEPRPTYSERRKRQIADGATPIPAKKAKKIRLAWVPCRPAEFLDSENGPKQMQQNSKFAAKFYSEADAIAAEQKNFEQVGYREEVKECAVCSGGNARKKCWHVFHIYRTELEGKQ